MLKIKSDFYVNSKGKMIHRSSGEQVLGFSVTCKDNANQAQQFDPSVEGLQGFEQWTPDEAHTKWVTIKNLGTKMVSRKYRLDVANKEEYNVSV